MGFIHRVKAGLADIPTRDSARSSDGGLPQTIVTTVDQVAASTSSAGTVFNKGGTVLSLSPASSAGAVLEVGFDRSPGQPVDRWIRMVPGSRARRPDGHPFGEFRVRRASGTPSSSTLTAVFDIDPSEQGFTVEHQGRFPQLSSFGALVILLRALDLAGNEVDLRCTDEGSLSIGAWDGAAYARLRTVTPASALAATAGTLDVFSRVAGYNGATWDRWTFGATNADSVATVTGGYGSVRAFGYTLDVGGSWDRMRSQGDGDAQTSPAYGLQTLARLQAYNGTSIDRLRCVTPADNLTATLGTLDTFARMAMFDGTNWKRVRCDGQQNMRISVYDDAGTGAVTIIGAGPGDGVSNSAKEFCVSSRMRLWNGSGYDRWYSGAGTAATGAARVVEAVPASSTCVNATVTNATGSKKAANASRKRTVVQALSTNTEAVYIGPSGVATSDGLELQPGQSHEWTSGDAIHAVIAGGGTMNLRIREETI